MQVWIRTILAVTLTLAAPSWAKAGGFEVGVNGSVAASRGGAFAVRADDLTALAHNPAGLLRLRGTHVMVSHNTVYSSMKFTRAPTAMTHEPFPVDPATGKAADPLAPVTNQTPWFALGGMLIAATDFGLENWAFAAGIYGPSAAGHQEWPETGGQRYMLTKLDVMLVYYSLAAAWGKRDHYGLGLTLQLAHEPNTELALVVDGDNRTNPSVYSPYYSDNDVLANIRMSAPPAITAIAGGWWRIAPNWEVGASGRIVPAYLKSSGDFTLSRTTTGAQWTTKQLTVDGKAARLDLVIPPTAHLGLRYRGLDGATERWDVELNGVYEAWSMLNTYEVQLDGVIKLFAAKEAPNVVIAKRWKDTLAVRLGGSYHIPNSALSLSAGSFYETGAVPNNYSHLDFPSFDRLGLSGGVQAKVGRFDLSLAYTHVFQGTRTVAELYGKVFQQRPVVPCPDNCTGPDGSKIEGVPVNAGTFASSFDVLSASVQVGF